MSINQIADYRSVFKEVDGGKLAGMRAYATDVRERALRAGVRGCAAVKTRRREVVTHLDISLATRERVRRRRTCEAGHVGPRPFWSLPRRISEADHPQLEAHVRAHADATLDEHVWLWHEAQGQQVHRATMLVPLRA